MDKLSFTSAKWQTDSSGEWLMVNVKDGEAKKLCEKLLQNKKYDLTVKQHREHRSLDANAYAWVLIDKLSEALHKNLPKRYKEHRRGVGKLLPAHKGRCKACRELGRRKSSRPTGNYG